MQLQQEISIKAAAAQYATKQLLGFIDDLGVAINGGEVYDYGGYFFTDEMQEIRANYSKEDQSFFFALNDNATGREFYYLLSVTSGFQVQKEDFHRLYQQAVAEGFQLNPYD